MNRLEYKYLIPNSRLSELRHRLLPYVQPDSHSVITGIGNYTVRSIYYDSRNLRYYYDKIEGLEIRQKVRVRTYNTFNESSRLFLEVKRKYQKSVSKHRIALPFQQGKALLENGRSARNGFSLIPPGMDDIGLNEFFFHVYHDLLQPVILISYEREAYFHKFNHNLRLTIDLNLRSSLSSDIANIFEEGDSVNLMRDHSIMEIKFFGGFPAWLTGMIGDLKLKHQALSKYCLCLERDLKLHQIRPRYGFYRIRSYQKSENFHF